MSAPKLLVDLFRAGTDLLRVVDNAAALRALDTLFTDVPSLGADYAKLAKGDIDLDDFLSSAVRHAEDQGNVDAAKALQDPAYKMALELQLPNIKFGQAFEDAFSVLDEDEVLDLEALLRAHPGVSDEIKATAAQTVNEDALRLLNEGLEAEGFPTATLDDVMNGRVGTAGYKFYAEDGSVARYGHDSEDAVLTAGRADTEAAPSPTSTGKVKINYSHNNPFSRWASNAKSGFGNWMTGFKPLTRFADFTNQFQIHFGVKKWHEWTRYSSTFNLGQVAKAAKKVSTSFGKSPGQVAKTMDKRFLKLEESVDAYRKTLVENKERFSNIARRLENGETTVAEARKELVEIRKQIRAQNTSLRSQFRSLQASTKGANDGLQKYEDSIIHLIGDPDKGIPSKTDAMAEKYINQLEALNTEDAQKARQAIKNNLEQDGEALESISSRLSGHSSDPQRLEKLQLAEAIEADVLEAVRSVNAGTLGFDGARLAISRALDAVDSSALDDAVKGPLKSKLDTLNNALSDSKGITNPMRGDIEIIRDKISVSNREEALTYLRKIEATLNENPDSRQIFGTKFDDYKKRVSTAIKSIQDGDDKWVKSTESVLKKLDKDLDEVDKAWKSSMKTKATKAAQEVNEEVAKLKEEANKAAKADGIILQVDETDKALTSNRKDDAIRLLGELSKRADDEIRVLDTALPETLNSLKANAVEAARHYHKIDRQIMKPQVIGYTLMARQWKIFLTRADGHNIGPEDVERFRDIFGEELHGELANAMRFFEATEKYMFRDGSKHGKESWISPDQIARAQLEKIKEMFAKIDAEFPGEKENELMRALLRDFIAERIRFTAMTYDKDRAKGLNQLFASNVKSSDLDDTTKALLVSAFENQQKTPNFLRQGQSSVDLFYARHRGDRASDLFGENEGPWLKRRLGPKNQWNWWSGKKLDKEKNAKSREDARLPGTNTVHYLEAELFTGKNGPKEGKTAGFIDTRKWYRGFIGDRTITALKRPVVDMPGYVLKGAKHYWLASPLIIGGAAYMPVIMPFYDDEGSALNPLDGGTYFDFKIFGVPFGVAPAHKVYDAYMDTGAWLMPYDSEDYLGRKAAGLVGLGIDKIPGDVVPNPFGNGEKPTNLPADDDLVDVAEMSEEQKAVYDAVLADIQNKSEFENRYGERVAQIMASTTTDVAEALRGYGDVYKAVRTSELSKTMDGVLILIGEAESDFVDKQTAVSLATTAETGAEADRKALEAQLEANPGSATLEAQLETAKEAEAEAESDLRAAKRAETAAERIRDNYRNNLFPTVAASELTKDMPKGTAEESIAYLRTRNTLLELFKRTGHSAEEIYANRAAYLAQAKAFVADPNAEFTDNHQPRTNKVFNTYKEKVLAGSTVVVTTADPADPAAPDADGDGDDDGAAAEEDERRVLRSRETDVDTDDGSTSNDFGAAAGRLGEDLTGWFLDGQTGRDIGTVTGTALSSAWNFVTNIPNMKDGAKWSGILGGAASALLLTNLIKGQLGPIGKIPGIGLVIGALLFFGGGKLVHYMVQGDGEHAPDTVRNTAALTRGTHAGGPPVTKTPGASDDAGTGDDDAETGETEGESGQKREVERRELDLNGDGATETLGYALELENGDELQFFDIDGDGYFAAQIASADGKTYADAQVLHPTVAGERKSTISSVTGKTIVSDIVIPAEFFDETKFKFDANDADVDVTTHDKAMEYDASTPIVVQFMERDATSGTMPKYGDFRPGTE